MTFNPKDIFSAISAYPDIPKFGVSKAPKKEAECDLVHVFMSLRSTSPHTQRRAAVAPTTPISRLRATFGSVQEVSLGPERVLDEHGFEFVARDAARPVSDFSKGCALSVMFEHDSDTPNPMHEAARSVQTGWWPSSNSSEKE